MQGRGRAPNRRVALRHAAPRPERLQVLEPLRRGQQLDRDDAGRVRENPLGLPRRAHSHGHDVLLVPFRRYRLHARGRRQDPTVGHERRGRDLGRHEPRLHPRIARQEGRQPGGQVGVHDALDPPFGEPGERRQGDPQYVEGEGHGLAVEVAAREHRAVEHERVVGGRIQLHGDQLLRERHALPHRAQYLGGAPQRIRVLHAGVVVAVRLADLRVREELTQQRRGALLEPVRPGLVDARVEWLGRPAGRLQAHRRSCVGGTPQHPGVVDDERRDAGLRLRSVHKGKPFLRLERDRLQAARLHGAAVFPFADHRERQVGQRGQIARRTDAPLRGHARVDALVQHRHDELRKGGPHAAGTAHQHIGAQQHHRSHGLLGQRIAHPGRMAADKVELQLAGTLGRDPHVRELPEAGGHPVYRGAARDRRLDGAARRPDAVECARGDAHGGAVPGDRYDVLDRERSTVQGDGGWHPRGSYALEGPDAKSGRTCV